MATAHKGRASQQSSAENQSRRLRPAQLEADAPGPARRWPSPNVRLLHVLRSFSRPLTYFSRTPRRRLSLPPNTRSEQSRRLRARECTGRATAHADGPTRGEMVLAPRKHLTPEERMSTTEALRSAIESAANITLQPSRLLQRRRGHAEEPADEVATSGRHAPKRRTS
jgi:hypothetical protein